MKIRILIIIKMNRNLLLVFMSMFLISFVSSQGLIVPETLSINYSTIDVNDSQYLRGYSPTTLRTSLGTVVPIPTSPLKVAVVALIPDWKSAVFAKVVLLPK